MCPTIPGFIACKINHYVVYKLSPNMKICHLIEGRLYRRLKVGDSVRVRFLPDDPRIFRPNWGSLGTLKRK